MLLHYHITVVDLRKEEEYNFLLKYIQIDNGEKIPKFTARGKETDVYQYLIEKQGPAQKIGENFKTILLLSINNDFFKGSLSISNIKLIISAFYYYCSFK